MTPYLKASLVSSLLIFAFPQSGEADDYEDLMEKLVICRDLKTPLKRLSCFEGLAPRSTMSKALGSSQKVEPNLAQEKPVVEKKALKKAVQKPQPLPVQKPKPLPVKKMVAPSVDKKEAFGAEHIPAAKEDEKENKADRTNSFKVIKFTQNRNNLYSFYMENGQVWRQMERQRISFPKKRAFEVVITQGSFGDYKMRIEGKGRQIRVKRIK